jgi:long-subunit acyl-CoA synthetase (AMP-forming)
MMTAYWSKPEQTAASLVDRWYRTGDAGRLDATERFAAAECR